MVANAQVLKNYHERIAAVQQHIRDHLDEPLDRQAVAAVAGFSVPHLHRIFKLYIGESIAAHIRYTRMERAGRKLRMGAVDITEVALAAGYDTHAAFSKAFKQQYGLSPSAFRQLDCFSATLLLRKGQTHEDRRDQRSD